MEALIKAGSFDAFAERGQLLANLEKLLEIARENNKNINSNQIGLFASSGVKIYFRLRPADIDIVALL